MQSNLSDICRQARERMAVPALPLAAIRTAAFAQPSARPIRRRGLVATLIAGVSIVAVAAAGQMLGTRVFFTPGGGFGLQSDQLHSYRNPTAKNLSDAAAHANFPVVLPAGLPEGTVLKSMFTAGPSAIALGYDLPGQWRRSNHVLQIVLANPQAVGSPPAKVAKSKWSVNLGGGRWPAHSFGPGEQGTHWMVGQEEVILTHSTLTAAEMAHLKSAMMAQAH